jgi:hypothetical protein
MFPHDQQQQDEPGDDVQDLDAASFDGFADISDQQTAVVRNSVYWRSFFWVQSVVWPVDT